jgi:excisionase family DNA binding protein
MKKTLVIELDKPFQSLLSDFVTQSEAAALLNLHPAAVRARVYRGSIASVRAGSAVLIPRTEIERIQRTYLPNRKSQGKASS